MEAIPIQNPINPPPPPPSSAGGNRNLLYILIGAAVLLLAAGAVYYFFFFDGIGGISINLKETPTIPAAQELTLVELKISRLSGFDFSVLQSSLYENLKTFGELPIKVDALGRPNPFLPY